MQKPAQMPLTAERYPLLPLRGLLAYPGMLLHFDVGRDRSIAAIEHALEDDKNIVVVAQRDAMKDNPHIEDMYGVGTIVEVKQVVRRPDDTISVLVEGVCRVMLLNVIEAGELQLSDVERFDPVEMDYTPEIAVYMETLKTAFRRYAELSGNVSSELRQSVEGDENPSTLGDVIAANVLRDIRKKQQILETKDVLKRMISLISMIEWECECMRLEKKIHARVQESIEQHQKEYYLREQLKSIHEELGDDESEIDDLEEKLKRSKMNEEAHNRVEREIQRMHRVAAQSPESSVSRNYIEYMLDLPWDVRTEKDLDIANARKILDEDHFGLDKVKHRILEYLAVRQIKGDLGGSIICLIGPPGVGKTSVARSVARAMGREFVRLSLGGLRDEAELRGHRRTYIGALPGRIISSIKQCGTIDPVFLLDEIDKMTSDMRGDPASAMLEVLDPEQNATFRDNFLEAPFDLSNVFFITTANTTEGIPRPLLDRMEIIEVPSYTLEEKVQIAKRHLWPKQLNKHGLKKSQARLTEKMIREIIDGYTREAGVRTLERELGAICRKVAVAILETPVEQRKAFSIGPERVKDYLGAPRYSHMKTLKKPETGIVNGLAWTSVGGETLSVEVAVMPGKGMIDLTGQLGDVMKESARTAYSYIRSRHDTYDIPDDFHERTDVHIHVPEGATPKDGPSAGVALTCAMVSALTGKPARQNIAMTGEITLRGRVLPIGGVKEKLLAAYRMGIDTILLPEENEKDLEDLPKDIRAKLDVKMIKSVDQAIDCVLIQ